MKNTVILTTMVLTLMALAALPQLWSGFRRRLSEHPHHYRHGAHP